MRQNDSRTLWENCGGTCLRNTPEISWRKKVYIEEKKERKKTSVQITNYVLDGVSHARKATRQTAECRLLR